MAEVQTQPQQSISRTFYDVEHGGDVDQITDAITRNGGVITRNNFNYDAETLELDFNVPDIKAFKKAIMADDDDNYWFSYK